MIAGPSSRLDKFLEALEDASDIADLQRLIERLRDHFGVDHAVYHWVSSGGEQYGCGTYPAAWVDLYITKDYLRIDPVIQGCYQNFHPVDWKRLDWSSRAARAFLCDAVAHGIGNQGYSVPLRGPNGQFALFSVSHDCSDEAWADFTDSHRRQLILIAHYFNSKALALEPGRCPFTTQPLSPREVDVITLLAMGYNRAQVAETLTISEHTLRTYVESARLKLGAINTLHAVARALSRGLIVIT